MSMGSSSSASTSVLRNAMRPRVISRMVGGRAESIRSAEAVSIRPFAAAAYQQPLESSETLHSDRPASAQYSGRSALSHSDSIPSFEPTTPESAQSYLSELLHLPPSRAFSPDLSLQILTHKSYRYAHLIRHTHSYRSRASSRSSDPTSESIEEGPSSVSHNSRLSFLGRRALNTYLALFLHSHLRTDRGLREVDFLRGKGLEEKMKAMTHVNNLGREVGSRWAVGDVMRWDRNETGKPGENVKIKGLTVESILGGVFTQHGSSAAHRAFHLHVLPHLSGQLRDPMLVERADWMRDEVSRELGGSIIGTTQ